MRALLDTIARAGGFTLQEQTYIGGGIADPDAGLPDTPYYRRMTAGSRDLNPAQFRAVQQACIRAFIMNPLARRMVELPKDFMVGEGVHPVSPDPTIQAWIDTFWDDPINQMDNLVELMALETEILGELALPLFVGADGRTRVTLIDTLLIRRTIPDPGNTRAIIGVELIGTAATDAVVIPTLLGPGADESQVLSREAIRAREGWRADLPEPLKSAGLTGILYVGLNRIAGMTRGLSTLSTSLDHLELTDRNLFDMLERAALINAFVWNVELAGATPEQITKYKADHPTPPKPGTVNVTNEKEKWTPLTPDLKQHDASVGFRTARNYAVGNLGFSPAWAGDVDATRATAAEQNDPALKTVTARQTRLKRILTGLLQHVVLAGIERGGLPKTVEVGTVTPVAKPSWQTVSVAMPEMSPRDVVRASSAFAQVATAASTAVAAGILSGASATKVLVTIAHHLGIDLDADAELAAVAQTVATVPLAEAVAWYRRAGVGGKGRRRARPAAETVPTS